MARVRRDQNTGTTGRKSSGWRNQRQKPRKRLNLWKNQRPTASRLCQQTKNPPSNRKSQSRKKILWRWKLQKRKPRQTRKPRWSKRLKQNLLKKQSRSSQRLTNSTSISHMCISATNSPRKTWATRREWKCSPSNSSQTRSRPSNTRTVS